MKLNVDLAIKTGDRNAFLARMGTEQLLRLSGLAIAFAVLFYEPMLGLARDWWELPEAGHGLLLAPVALWLVWREQPREPIQPQWAWGVLILAGVVGLRYAAGLAAEIFSMRMSMVVALAGIVVFHFGARQLLRWWLPFTLAALSIPLPELITQALALPLQFKASEMGASLLEWRGVPVRLTGNVIRLPGHELFVTEACSGLRSLTALVSTAILTGAVILKTPVSRVALLALAIPLAILINGVRVFITGFLVFFVSPSLGTGFMHATEGWLLFLVSLAGLAAMAMTGLFFERLYFQHRRSNA